MTTDEMRRVVSVLEERQAFYWRAYCRCDHDERAMYHAWFALAHADWARAIMRLTDRTRHLV